MHKHKHQAAGESEGGPGGAGHACRGTVSAQFLLPRLVRQRHRSGYAEADDDDKGAERQRRAHVNESAGEERRDHASERAEAGIGAKRRNCKAAS